MTPEPHRSRDQALLRDAERATVFSPCRKYRYTLWREWEAYPLALEWEAKRFQSYLMIIGLNPSTADETKDDPTIRRCIDFAKQWGFGALCMTNLFAFRATHPAEMKKAEMPAGMDNEHHIRRRASQAGFVLVAWGKHGKHHHQDLNVCRYLREIEVQPYCLGTNGDGTPKHPLYLPKDSKPIPFTIR